MKKDMPVDNNYFDDFDFDTAKSIKHPLIKKLQDNVVQQNGDNLQDLPIDDDIVQWLLKQDDNTKRHINEVLRHVMAVKMV